MDSAASPTLVSADDHFQLNSIPPTLWSARLPVEFRAVGPRVEEGPDGPTWMAEGRPMGPSGDRPGSIYALRFKRAGISDNLAFRTSDPQLRMRDMDLDGVSGQVINPPLAELKIQDPALRLACIRAYNDWAAEFNNADRGRLCAMITLPADNPVEAAREVERSAALGHRAALLSFFHASPNMFDPAWEPLWEAAAAAGIVVSVHLASGTHTLQMVRKTDQGDRSQSWQERAYAAVVTMQLDEVLAGFVFSGILERHRALRVMLAECGIGWVPYLLDRMDRMQTQFSSKRELGNELSMKPSDYFHRQMFVTFEEDPVGIGLIPAIGAENVMWASDYPHPDGTFPYSRESVRESFKGLPDDLVRKVTAENAAKAFQLVLPRGVLSAQF